MVVARERTESYGLPETPAPQERAGNRRRTSTWDRKDRLVFTGLVLLIFCSCVVISFYYAQIISTGYRLNKAQHELNLLRTESHDLYTKINQLSSLDYIEVVAVHKLGMVAPEQDDVVLVQAPMANTVGNGAPAPVGTEAEVMAVGDEQTGHHPVIQAFADMVERLEKSIRTS